MQLENNSQTVSQQRQGWRETNYSQLHLTVEASQPVYSLLLYTS